jgi:hypothetical protein
MNMSLEGGMELAWAEGATLDVVKALRPVLPLFQATDLYIFILSRHAIRFA